MPLNIPPPSPPILSTSNFTPTLLPSCPRALIVLVDVAETQSIHERGGNPNHLLCSFNPQRKIQLKISVLPIFLIQRNFLERQRSEFFPLALYLLIQQMIDIIAKILTARILFKFHCLIFCIKMLFFQSRFIFTAKLKRQKNFLYTSCPHTCITSLIINIHHQQGTFVIADYSTWTHNHLKSIVYITVHYILWVWRNV